MRFSGNMNEPGLNLAFIECNLIALTYYFQKVFSGGFKDVLTVTGIENKRLDTMRFLPAMWWCNAICSISIKDILISVPC